MMRLLNQVEECKQDNPDHIHEMPVQAESFQSQVVFRGNGAAPDCKLKQGGPDYTDHNVSTVDAGDGKKGSAKVGIKPDAFSVQGDPFNSLATYKDTPQDHNADQVLLHRFSAAVPDGFQGFNDKIAAKDKHESIGGDQGNAEVGLGDLEIERGAQPQQGICLLYTSPSP